MVSLPKPHEQSYQALFYRHGILAHRHAALLCLVLPLLRASGKDKTMKIPKTPYEFDYDLWTTEDGKCMVRVKLTGEVTEVDREVMRILRAEEKKLRRSSEGVTALNGEKLPMLSLDYVSFDDCEGKASDWLMDSHDPMEEILFDITEADFRKSLTEKQLDVYLNCVVKGMSQKAYADRMGISPAAVFYTYKYVREKAKKYFSADT